MKVVKKIKEHPFRTIFLLLICIPCLVYGLSEFPIMPVCGNNDWAGFWGGYIGAIIGGIVTIVGIYISFEEEKKQRIEPRLITNCSRITKEDFEQLDYNKRGYVIYKEVPNAGDTIASNEEFLKTFFRNDKEVDNRKLFLYEYRISNPRNNEVRDIKIVVREADERGVCALPVFSLGYNQDVTLILAFNFVSRVDSNIEINIEFQYSDMEKNKKYEQIEGFFFYRDEMNDKYIATMDIKGMLTEPREIE